MIMSAGTMVAEKIIRRNPKGCKSEDFYNWPEEPFEEMDSTIAVQQYIQQKIRKDPSNIDEILTPPKGQDLGAWKYEHMRQFCMELNKLTVKLQSECNPETCSQMTATEQWIFLCAAHKAPKECPAIDYTRHTLDGAAGLLNSNKYFPSRVTIKEASMAKLASVCRRVYRIFSHAYYHHKSIYDQFESETHLCKRFSVFSIRYELMSTENLIVPIAGIDFNDIKKVTSNGSTGNGQQPPTASANNNELNTSTIINSTISTSATGTDNSANTGTILRGSTDSSEA